MNGFDPFPFISFALKNSLLYIFMTLKNEPIPFFYRQLIFISFFHVPFFYPNNSGGRLDPKDKSILGQQDDDEGDDEQPPDAFLVSFTTACGVTFVLCLIWIASRWTVTCIRSRHRSQEALESVCHAVPSAPPPSTTTPTSSVRQQRHQRSLWTWMSPQAERSGRAVHQLDDDDSLPAYSRQLDRSQSTDQDRVALIAYMNDSNTSSQVSQTLERRISFIS